MHGTWPRPGRTQRPGWNRNPVVPLAVDDEGRAGRARSGVLADRPRPVQLPLGMGLKGVSFGHAEQAILEWTLKATAP